MSQNETLIDLLRAQDRKTAAAREMPVLDPVYPSPVATQLFNPGTRAFWPVSSRDANGAVYDISGQGRTLTNNNTVTFGLTKLVPYASFASASSQYFSRAHETDLNPTAALWGMAWVNFTTLGTQTGIISKYLAAANFSYRLVKTTGNVIRMQVTSDGTSGTEVTHDHTATILASTWYHLAFRFNGAITEMRIWVNGAAESKTSGVPGTVFNATGAAFEIGRSNSSNYFNGVMTLMEFGSTGLDNAHVQNSYRAGRWALGV